MAIFELTENTVSEIPVILTDGAGSAVTGVAKGQVDPYFRKEGGASTQLAAVNFDWTELDATNMPGQYILTINATGVGNGILDTQGSFHLTIKEDAVGPPVFVGYPAYCYVVPLSYWDTLRRIRAWHSWNYRMVATAWDSVSKEPTAGTLKIYPTAADADADTNAIEAATLTATFDAEGRVTLYKSTG